MRQFDIILIATLLLLLSGGSNTSFSHAQQASPQEIRYKTSYQVAKPIIENAWSSGSSIDIRRKALLGAAQKAYGSKATQLLGGSLDILPEIEGGMKTAKGLASNSASQRKGAARLARMVGTVGGDARFKVTAVEQLVYEKKNGRRKIVTDRDLVFRHRETGSLNRIEVKEVKKSSQYSNLEKYKRQINLMAKEQLATGRPQAFVNRRPLIPLLEKHANKMGVAAYGNVVTSNTGAPATLGQIHVNDVLDDMDKIATRNFRVRSTVGGFGMAMALVEGRNAYQEWQKYANGNESALNASYHTANAAAGASFAASGIASNLATQMNASSRAAKVLGGIGRYGGPAGITLAGAGMGIHGYQYYSGQINTRQFVQSTSTSGGALAGGLAGAWGGGALGAYGGPYAFVTVPAGAIIGGFVGAFGGQKAASIGVEAYYSRLDEQQQAELFDSLRNYYHN